jgi:hypothetical protein
MGSSQEAAFDVAKVWEAKVGVFIFQSPTIQAKSYFLFNTKRYFLALRNFFPRRLPN